MDDGLNKPQEREKWYLRWWSVLGLLVMFGPFALPAVWKSKDFSRWVKWGISVMVLVLTIIAVWMTWAVAEKMIEELQGMSDIY